MWEEEDGEWKQDFLKKCFKRCSSKRVRIGQILTAVKDNGNNEARCSKMRCYLLNAICSYGKLMSQHNFHTSNLHFLLIVS